MISKEDILYMIAHIAHKELEYKWVKEYISLPEYEDNDQVGFAVIISEDGSTMNLLFRTSDGYKEYFGHPGEIMENLFRGTNTEYIFLSEAAFHIDEFDFDAVKSVGEQIEYM